MNRRIVFAVAAAILVLAGGASLWWFSRGDQGTTTAEQASITVDYPEDGSIFPPEFPPPTFLWRDNGGATVWRIEVTFGNGSEGLEVESPGNPMQIGEIDPRCVSDTNEPPQLTPQQAAAHTWKPKADAWDAIKKNSRDSSAIVSITGYRNGDFSRPLSEGRVTLRTSSDSVGAPIFYRDVPLMPAETEKGVIRPLAGEAVPLIAWRLRNVAETKSHILMQGLHSCANCHSFSLDGKTMGMDVDGPQNDKGLYALVPVKSHMTIDRQHVIQWSTFRGKLGGRLRVGFMSQVSPHGRYVVTTINDPGVDQTQYERRTNPQDLVPNYYVANFKDYRFLQVFYPTRGILAWYSKETGQLRPLPGADDPKYVQSNATWSPDGTYLVFSRAEAKNAYQPGRTLPLRANDPSETQIRYDLCRIPFNGGKGGRAVPIAGASADGMSNTFPKVSPDGRWIVFVKCRNGQLMRPDSQLYIVAAGGGQARRMRCNLSPMNSWHSFSPNGRWLVFSSKGRSPYTQMFLTHIDEGGNDSPAILIENSTAANRAVNIPEFVNIDPEGIEKIDAPVTVYYQLVDKAMEMMKNHRYREVIPVWREALAHSPDEAMAHNNLGVALADTGKVDEAIVHYRRALELDPKYPQAYNNLGEALASQGKTEEAIAQFRRVLELSPEDPTGEANLGTALIRAGRIGDAIPYLEKAVELQPDVLYLRRNLGLALVKQGRAAEAIPHAEKAAELSGGRDPALLELLAEVYGQAHRISEALETAHRALSLATEQNNARLIENLKARIQYYESQK